MELLLHLIIILASQLVNITNVPYRASMKYNLDKSVYIAFLFPIILVAICTYYDVFEKNQISIFFIFLVS